MGRSFFSDKLTMINTCLWTCIGATNSFAQRLEKRVKIKKSWKKTKTLFMDLRTVSRKELKKEKKNVNESEIKLKGDDY